MATQDLRKKIRLQNMAIIILSVVIVIMLCVSTTAAWYIRSKSDSAEVVLAEPVNIELTDKGVVTKDILKEFDGKISPGDKIVLDLGFKLGTTTEPSSPAYVRVKLNIVYEDKNGNFKGLSEVGVKGVDTDAKIYYEDEPDSNLWQLVDFNRFRIEQNLLDENGNPYDHDYWYVLKDSKDVAKVAYNGEPYTFLDGYIKLDKINNTNADANAKFHFQYVAEAMQVANVPDPLAEQGHGPWWDFILGDGENLENS